MKKVIIAGLVSMIIPLRGIAQGIGELTPARTDSLLAVIANPPNDTADLNARYLIAREWVWTRREAADSLINQLIEQSEVREKPFWLAQGFNVKGRLKEISGEVDSALWYNQRSLDVFKKGEGIAFAKGYIRTLLNRGAYHHASSNYEEAIEYYHQAYYHAKPDHPLLLAKVLNNLGVVYRRIGRVEESREIYQESIELKRTANDSLGLANSLHNLAILELEGNSEIAMSLFREARSIYELLGEIGEANSIDVGIGQAYYNGGDLENARIVWETAIAKPELKLDLRSAAYLFLGLSDVYLVAGEIDRGFEYASSGLEYAERLNQPRVIADFKKLLGMLHRQRGESELAAAYLEEYALVIDTLVKSERLRKEQEMSERFAAEKREAEIDRQSLLIGQQRQRNWFLGVVLILLMALSLGGYFVFRYRLRAKEGEALLREAEKKREIDTIRKGAELDKLKSVLAGQEAERRRVARDLHDGLGGLLATVKARMPRSAGDDRSEADRLLDRACTEVRRIAHNMAPQSLALSGLSGALGDVVAQLQLQGVECDYEIVGQPDLRLEEEEQLMVLRILQELTYNIIKHARAEKVFIQLLDQPHQLLLTVEDDGIGFFPEEQRGVGLGLTSIDTRVSYLGGTIMYDSSPGRGTTVTITIPL